MQTPNEQRLIKEPNEIMVDEKILNKIGNAPGIHFVKGIRKGMDVDEGDLIQLSLAPDWKNPDENILIIRKVKANK